jgi:hypothetical protein
VIVVFGFSNCFERIYFDVRLRMQVSSSCRKAMLGLAGRWLVMGGSRRLGDWSAGKVSLQSRQQRRKYLGEIWRGVRERARWVVVEGCCWLCFRGRRFGSRSIALWIIVRLAIESSVDLMVYNISLISDGLGSSSVFDCCFQALTFSFNPNHRSNPL